MIITEEFSKIKGSLKENADLSEFAWFGTGGKAELLFIPADIDDLRLFLKIIGNKTPITVIGATSNILVRSGGVDGVVIKLGKWFGQIFLEENVIEIGAAAKCTELAVFAMDHDLGGLEYLVGIPGTIGGAIRMNAGCYGGEIFNGLIEFEALGFDGNIKWIKARDVEYKYRSTNITNNMIITRAWFTGLKDVDYSISKKIRDIINKKQKTQPLDKRSCGSTFKNPEGHKAWELIEAAGCKGLTVGDAVVSTKHCNFIVNNGKATPDDIENLGELVIQKVKEHSGITLEWEIIRIGKKNTKEI